MEEVIQNYWYVIPAELAEKGKPLKALLFGLISSLCNKSGKCFASNKYLAKKLGFKSERTVSQYINELVDDKYLTSQIAIQSGNQRTLQIGIASECARSSVEMRDPSSVRMLHSNISISNKREYIAHFDTFWSKYPKKIGKKKALDSWMKIDFKDDLFDKILAAIDNQIRSNQWQKDGGQFIPYPATWLNQERWNDVLESKQRPKNFMIGEEGYVEI